MHSAVNQKLAGDLVDMAYIRQGSESLRAREKQLTSLLSHRKLPEHGWDDLSIQGVLHEFAQMDSNNFAHNVGAGEREARVASSLVANRCFHLAHGVGRSGDICAIQPKAAGSSLMVQLTNLLVKDMLHIAGLKNAKCAIVLPVATGMAMLFALLTLQLQARSAGHAAKRYVLWPRIDQKSCFKAMVTAGRRRNVSLLQPDHSNVGLEPVVVENVLVGDELRTDLEALEAKIVELGAENILCVLSTTSCFAPRGYDRVEEIAQMCRRHDIGMSPRRASNAPLLDLFITMLHLGSDGYKALLAERKALVPYFKAKLTEVADSCGERLLHTPHNDISFCMTLQHRIPSVDATTFLGSMLFSRGVSGTRTSSHRYRVVSTIDVKSVGGHQFIGFGAHANAYPSAYLTAACAIGMTKSEIDVFAARLWKALVEFQTKSTFALPTTTTPVQ
ncbi:hypothetical protein DYB26_001325, partial [Aphanomyces astaci]